MPVVATLCRCCGALSAVCRVHRHVDTGISRPDIAALSSHLRVPSAGIPEASSRLWLHVAGQKNAPGGGGMICSRPWLVYSGSTQPDIVAISVNESVQR